MSFLAYAARTQTPGNDGQDLSYQGRFNYAGDLYGGQVEHLVVEDNFIPEVGFLRRDNFRRTYGTARYSPRPRSLAGIRQFRLEGSYDYIETADLGIVETRQTQLAFSTELENSDRFGFSVADNYEFLHREFTPGPDEVAFPVGGYQFFDVEGTYSPGAQRRLNGTVTVRAGDYFNGTIRSVGFSRGRMEVTQQLSLEPSVSVNWIDSPQGSFRTDPARVARELLLHAAHVLQRPDSVQLEHQHRQQQPPAPLGVSARQRALRGLHRGPRDRPPAPRPLLGAPQPRVRRQGEPAVPLLARRRSRALAGTREQANLG